MSLATLPNEITFPGTPFYLEPAMVMLTRRGSEAHGTYVKSNLPDSIDDRDLLGFVVPPKNFYTGLQQWSVVEGINGVWDVVLYDMQKAVRLLMTQNPNVLTALWCELEDIVTWSTGGALLRQHRDLFRHGPEARQRFIGYARDQLQRMTAFDAKTMAHIDYLEQMLKDAGIDPQHVIAEPPIQVPDRMALVAKEYRECRKRYKLAYMGEKRWGLVRLHGFDSKNASHMIRLLHMGIEYLQEGVLHVRRTWDVDMLKEIKSGEWDLATIQGYAEQKFQEIEDAKSVLPESLDEDAIEKVLMRIIQLQHLES